MQRDDDRLLHGAIVAWYCMVRLLHGVGQLGVCSNVLGSVSWGSGGAHSIIVAKHVNIQFGRCTQHQPRQRICSIGRSAAFSGDLKGRASYV